MQNIKMRLRVDSTVTQQVDDSDQPINKPPAIVRGMQCNLVLELIDSSINPLENLEKYTAWDFVLADDWLTSTTAQLHIAEGITANGNVVNIPLFDTDNELLVEALGNKEEITLGAELAGFDAESDSASFLIQFNLKVRNRRGTTKPENSSSYPFAVDVIDFTLSNVTSETLPVGTYNLGRFLVEPTSVIVNIGNDVITNDGTAVNGCSVYTENNVCYLQKQAVSSTSSSSESSISSDSGV